MKLYIILSNAIVTCFIMSNSNKSYIINNLQERLYTLTIYFKKNENIKEFLDFLKEHISEKNISWNQNTCNFISKEPYYKLQEKYKKFFNNLKKWKCFLNYKLTFKNHNSSITLFTIINPLSEIDIDNFVNCLNKYLNEMIDNIKENIKETFNIKSKNHGFLSYALINGKKLLITIDKDLYFILNVLFAENKKIFELSEQDRIENLKRDKFLHSYLFSFRYENKDYNFKEFLNTCKICKNFHFDSNKKNCFPICTPCGEIKERDHVCKQKTFICGLCKLYYNKQLKHVPFDSNCLHKKNIEQEMFIKTRQTTLIQIFSKAIKPEKKVIKKFSLSEMDFPLLKNSYDYSLNLETQSENNSNESDC